MNENLFESDKSGGTYAAILLSEQSRLELFKFCVDQGIENLVASDDYHCTLLYSRTACEEIINEDFGLPCSALPVGYKLLGTDEKVIVLELYCPMAVKLHELFMNKYGATHDYPEYIPHITIAKSFSGDIPIELPDMMIEFDDKTVEEISNK